MTLTLVALLTVRTGLTDTDTQKSQDYHKDIIHYIRNAQRCSHADNYRRTWEGAALLSNEGTAYSGPLEVSKMATFVISDGFSSFLGGEQENRI